MVVPVSLSCAFSLMSVCPITVEITQICKCVRFNFEIMSNMLQGPTGDRSQQREMRQGLSHLRCQPLVAVEALGGEHLLETVEASLEVSQAADGKHWKGSGSALGDPGKLEVGTCPQGLVSVPGARACLPKSAACKLRILSL